MLCRFAQLGYVDMGCGYCLGKMGSGDGAADMCAKDGVGYGRVSVDGVLCVDVAAHFSMARAAVGSRPWDNGE